MSPTSDTPQIAPELAAAGFTETSTPQVLTARVGSLGRIMLNNPRAINALTLPMVQAVTETLDAWRDDSTLTAITIEGAGDRGLCAGGDVRSVRQAYLEAQENGSNLGPATDFFEHEYAMNAALASYPKLIVSLQDGIVMGGGIGISAYCGLRVATERTQLAMPETIIGFFPDVGALYLLSRAPGGLGRYLALTGVTINGPDAVAVGFSDAVIDAATWPQVLDRLAAGAGKDAVAGLLVSRETSLAAQRDWIDECFGAAADDASPTQIRDALLAHSNPAAHKAAELLALRSPISVATTMEALRRASAMGSVHEVLEQDKMLAKNLLVRGDFVEGVRAQLVDKDRSPQWPDTLDDITPERVAVMFEK